MFISRKKFENISCERNKLINELNTVKKQNELLKSQIDFFLKPDNVQTFGTFTAENIRKISEEAVILNEKKKIERKVSLCNFIIPVVEKKIKELAEKGKFSVNLDFLIEETLDEKKKEEYYELEIPIKKYIAEEFESRNFIISNNGGRTTYHFWTSIFINWNIK